MSQENNPGASKVRKVLHVLFKVLLTLISIIPILGVTGIFPEPTREMYNTDEAFKFIQVLIIDAGYIQYCIAFAFAVTVILLWSGREALAAIIITPVTINIVGYHMFIDGGLLTGGAIMGNVLFLLNLYFLWQNTHRYKFL